MADKTTRKDQFTWNGATIGVKDLTIADDLRVTTLTRRAMGGSADPDDPEFTITYNFAEFMIAADVQGDAPLPMADEHSSDEDIDAALNAWRNLPRKFGRKWTVALNASMGDEDPN